MKTLEEEFEEAIESNDRQEKAREYFLDSGKPEINNLVWQFLPGNTTLDEAEQIAAKIYYMIEEEWNKKI